MALRKALRRKSGASGPPAGKVQISLHDEDLKAAVEQLQETVNELIVRHNAHQHSALNAAPSTGLVTGTSQTDSGLFVAAATT